MGSVEEPQLVDTNAQQNSSTPLFQPHNLSSLDLFQKQNSFGFSPGTSPVPNDIKNGDDESFFDLASSYTPVSNYGSLVPTDSDYKPSVKNNWYHTISPQSTQQLSRLQIPSTTTRQRYGQFTPPSETTPTDDSLPFYPAREPKTLPVDTRTGHTTMKRRRTQPSQVSEAPSQPVATPCRRKKSSRKQSSIESTADGNDKRSQFLERNRIAASKCRQKKKEWTSNLETRARELQASKKSLALLVSSLREELLYLKGEALKHTTCDCHSVREYLARQAEVSFPCNRHDCAHSPRSSPNLSFEAMDLDSAVMLDSPDSLAMAENQSLPELNMLGQVPD